MTPAHNHLLAEFLPVSGTLFAGVIAAALTLVAWAASLREPIQYSEIRPRGRPGTWRARRYLKENGGSNAL